MKTVFVLRLSEDGINNEAATNIKAAYRLIVESGYSPVFISYFHERLKKLMYNPFSYSNLVKSIREAQKKHRFTVATIECENRSQIEINEIGLVSK